MKTKYLLILLAVFSAEILIATRFSEIGFVRGYLRDFLVVILLYFFVKIFRGVPPLQLAIGIFVFACGMEVTQYYHLADLLGFRRGSLISILLGNSFSWLDMVAYFLGSFAAYLLDTFLHDRTILMNKRNERGLG